jgi:threonine-phosphate decarboxylase
MCSVDFLHGGNIYEIERKYKKEIIDFSANINPLGLPQEVKRALYKNFDKILHYPDLNAAGLVQKIAKYWGVNKKNILLGNGSAELIYLIAAAFRPGNTLIPMPTFSEYERAAKSAGSKISFLRLRASDHFRLNLSSVNLLPRQNLRQRAGADLFFLCHPNNPTGNFIVNSSKSIERLINGLVVVDEAFMDFLPDQENYTLVWKAAKSKKIAVLRTFTKMFALPGLRIGYLVAHEDTIRRLKKHQPPWNTNSLAQLTAELILENKEYVKKSVRLVEKERRFLSNEIAKIGRFNPYPSLTNFLFIKIKGANFTSSLLRERLIQKGILIRDCANFRGLGNKFVRIAVRLHRENLKLIEALKEVI